MISCDKLAVAVAIAALMPSPGWAQGPGTDVREMAYASMAAPATLALGALPGAELTGKVTAVELILEGTQDEGVGTAAFGWKRGSAQYRAKFSGPISKSTNQAVPFDLTEGLGTGATFEFTAGNLMWAQASDEDLEAMRRLCQQHLSRQSCDVPDLPAAVQPEARRLLKLDAVLRYLGGSLVVSQKDFDFLDAAFASQSESHRNVSGTARFGAFSPIFGFGFVSWSYQRQYRAGGDPQQICLPLSGTNGFACSEAVLGAPTTKTGSILGAELRHFFSAAYAIAPSIKRDLKADVTSVAVPFYFLRNKEGGLTGGVRSSWRSDTKSIAVAVFIGTSLSLTP